MVCAGWSNYFFVVYPEPPAASFSDRSLRQQRIIKMRVRPARRNGSQDKWPVQRPATNCCGTGSALDRRNQIKRRCAPQTSHCWIRSLSRFRFGFDSSVLVGIKKSGHLAVSVWNNPRRRLIAHVESILFNFVRISSGPRAEQEAARNRNHSPRLRDPRFLVFFFLLFFSFVFHPRHLLQYFRCRPSASVFLVLLFISCRFHLQSASREHSASWEIYNPRPPRWREVPRWFVLQTVERLRGP